MGMSAVVGTTIANAVGHAYALKYRKQGAIVASFFGDGATEEGVFAESLNFAALKKVPILFVCENNGYAIHTAQERRQGSLDLCRKATAFGVPGTQADGSDVMSLMEISRSLIEKVRAGLGPQFLEVKTYRWREHVGPNTDFQLGYRTPSEAEPWMEKDAVRLLGERLAPAERERIQQEVEAEIAEAFAFAESSPFPAESELMTDIYGGAVACNR
jgi:TPP-dependent pyruvate/acetoin dehydrogenase alpha subunit